MAAKTWRLATRGSALAKAQAQTVADAVSEVTGEPVELVIYTTKGDRVTDRPLSQVGGKGLFTKEIEEALLSGECDFAVHSMKDLPTVNPEPLTIAAIPARGDARDALVGATMEDLRTDNVVGTGSARRRLQILARRPDLKVGGLRGNVGTRVGKQRDGTFHAVVLACAGLQRLDRAEDITEACDPSWMVPAVGQGALGVQCRVDDAATKAVLAQIHHEPTAVCVEAERAYMIAIDGGCSVPAACYAVLQEDSLWLRAFYAKDDGSRWAWRERSGPKTEAQALGRALAEEMREVIFGEG